MKPPGLPSPPRRPACYARACLARHRSTGRLGLLLEAVHQLIQVVASVAKSGPEHYAYISFFAWRLCLADLGKVIKSCFQFLLQEIAPYSKRNFVFFRIVWHKSARMHVGVRGEVSYPSARKCSALNSMFLKYRL
jgi:hypothetical protein